ncbi:hypothetical protein LPJ53_006409 [Coemansia erecta]|uniref:C2H2-type domain-containing protein n=1 Tax=Coemansia erecta TaxID=147472 RepID=A0A9W8CPA3_9FUNG|nr:hypothetical protein LPJ53_006409 [Coemansia erecta]
MDVGALLDSHTHTHAHAHSPAKGFQCSWADCDRSFARKSDLVRHFRIHTGVKPFECPWDGCDKRFIQRSALKVHFRTHSGERPHTCESCDRSFSDSSSLARHRRTHTGVRPYGCDHPGCAKRFTRKTSLRKHMLTHSTDYTRTRRPRANSSSSGSSVVGARAESADCSETASSLPSSATASPVLSNASPAHSQASSPLLSVKYLTSPTQQYDHSHRFHVRQQYPPATERDGSSSPSSTVYGGSPLMHGVQGAVLPPISALFN